MSDWTESNLKQRSIKAAEYMDYANIPVGDDTYEIPYTLPNQTQMLDVQESINVGSIAEAQADIEEENDDVKEAEDLIQELQTKDDLSKEQERELRNAQITLAKNRGAIIDALGRETLDAFYNLGRNCIEPDEEDISNVLSNPAEAIARFEDIDGAQTPSNGEWTRNMVRDALKAEMQSILDDVPFMIYFTLGQTVFEQAQSAGKLVES